jgi:dipeptidyl-peptidase 4
MMKLSRRRGRVSAGAAGALCLIAGLAIAPAPLRSADAAKPEGVVKAVTANYALAARWTPERMAKVIFDTTVTPHWLDSGDRFWYAWEDAEGRRFYLVDPVRKSKKLLFDPAALAAGITMATGIPEVSHHLPFTTIKFVDNDTVIQFQMKVPREAEIPGYKDDSAEKGVPQQGGRGAAPAGPPNHTKTLYFDYELATGKLTLLPSKPPSKPRWASISPDGKTIVFARNHNLYMMDAANYAKAEKNAHDKTIVETQLTTDGVDGFSYARHLYGAERDREQKEDREKGVVEDTGKDARVQPIMIFWSKDSKKFALVRHDERKVAELWVINSLSQPRPTLETFHYPMPGEANVPQSQLEIFDVASKARVIAKADAFKDQEIRIESDRILGRNREHERAEPRWVSPTSDKLYFTRLSRDMHKLDLCVADTAAGTVKPLIEERMNVYVEAKPLRLVDHDTDMLWWSERDGWGHYYLYGTDGTLKNRVTHGEFVMEDVLGVDDKARVAFITGEGHEHGEDPYYPHIYRVNLDGSGMRLLDPGDASHAVAMSDSGRFFVDNYSRVDAAPKSVLYDSEGETVMPLEATDLSAALHDGFRFAERFQVKADDGITDLYGVMYKPFDFDPAKKYPVIAYVYPGPQTEAVTQVFTTHDQNVGLAQFGFIVIEVGNRGGNPHRSKWYHTFGYGNLRDYGLADKKAAIEQLAERYPFIDANRVGIWGHSGGGFMSTAAILEYPDFFKVAFSESGNHENEIYNNTWSEKHNGIHETDGPDGTAKFQYSIDTNSALAKNLKGHLMLTTGDIDDNVSPSNTYRLVNALIKANKRFDMLVLPGKRHAYADEAQYVFWRRGDYFSKYLLGDFSQGVDMQELIDQKLESGDKQHDEQRRQVTEGKQQEIKRTTAGSQN